MTDKEIEALWLQVTGFNADDERADIAGFARALLASSALDAGAEIDPLSDEGQRALYLRSPVEAATPSAEPSALTDAQIKELFVKNFDDCGDFLSFARAVLAARSAQASPAAPSRKIYGSGVIDAIEDFAPVPPAATSSDARDAARYRALKAFAHHSYNQKVESVGHGASLWKEHFITVHAGSWEELDSHIDAAIAAQEKAPTKEG
ncbi:hypothetical protein [Caballeronia sp. AZ10_KS36]|uniref:hypothetical protein n=1 Tax=Caballeronia sp. AZ10_KS36 TaxID=2921757 RepID=UPI002028E609|nr:hypothetical protein [Caballeronia sp. AZ10_KS36]